MLGSGSEASLPHFDDWCDGVAAPSHSCAVQGRGSLSAAPRRRASEPNRSHGSYFVGTSDHGMPDEISALVKAGLPPMDAIRAGSSVSAECLGVANRVGEIKSGLAADFVAVNRNPLTDISALQEIVLIIHDGDVVVNRLSGLLAEQNTSNHGR